MKYSEIRDLTVEELKKRYDGLVEDLFQLRMKRTMVDATNPLSVRTTRRNI